MFISHNSAQIYAVEFGSGPRTILGLGGWAGSWELWTGPFSELSKTWRTVAYDHRGTGATIAPVESITVENMVQDLFAVMDRMQIDKCVLAAESAGGMVAVQAVLEQPHRFEGLVLVDALLHRENDASNAAFIQGLKTNFEETIHGFVRSCVPASEPNSREIRSWGSKILFRASPEAAVRLIECAYGVDLRPGLAHIQVPVLLLHGDRDVIVPLGDSEFIASMLPHGCLRVFKGAGHVPTMTRPREVADEINQYFIKK
jgi:pimeloyl-ACP methyl ester carboxylesterase